MIYRDPHAQTLIEMMMQNMQTDQHYADREQQRSAERWDMLANMPTQAYETYLGVKDRERAEEEHQRALDRQALLDERYADEQAQKARDLKYKMGTERAALLKGQSAEIIAQATGGETARPFLAGEGEGTDPGIVYTPGMSTEPVPEQVVSSRVMVDGEPISESTGLPTSIRHLSGLDAWRGLPQAEPGVQGAWVSSRVEGEPDVFFPIESAEERAFNTAEKNIADLAQKRSEQDIKNEGDIETAVETQRQLAALQGIEIKEADVVNADGTTNRVGYNARTGEEVFSFSMGRVGETTDGNGDPFSTEQYKAARFAIRHVDGNKIINEIVGSPGWRAMEGLNLAERMGTDIFWNAKTQTYSLLANAFQDPTERRFATAAMDIVTAQLRRESGALISIDEFTKDAFKYIPNPTDDDDLLREKMNRRVNNEVGELEAAGGAYEKVRAAADERMDKYDKSLVRHPLIGTETEVTGLNGEENTVTVLDVEVGEDGIEYFTYDETDPEGVTWRSRGVLEDAS